MALVKQFINRAAENGQSEIQVYEFPSSLCTDRGRAINSFEADWYKSLSARLQPRMNSGATICRRLDLG
jgi:hypothetical protein